MRRGRLICRSIMSLIVWLLLLAGSVMPTAATGGPHRAGLIIVHGDGRVLQQCVAFAEETINGMTLLQRSGLDLSVDPSNAIGIAVCRIDSEGCTYPRQACFCQCQGASCIYWSYWNLTTEGLWKYSNSGSSNRTIRDGDVDAWAWGSVNNTTVGRLPAIRFADICAAPTPTVSPTATATETPTASPAPPTSTPTWTPRPPSSPTHTPRPPTATTAPTAVATLTLAAPVASVTATSSPTAAPLARLSPPSLSVAQLPAAALPTATLQPGTPMVTTPTAPPAPSPQSVPRTTTPTHPVRTDVPGGSNGAAAGEASPTAGAASVVAAQRANSTTVRAAAIGPSPTPLLGGHRQLTSTPPAGPPAVDATTGGPAEMLPALAFLLAAAGLFGVVRVRTRRRPAERRTP